mmetsp:Transcript_15658/g.29710  ORF Transcript_15658/g.29710 Transcript_15658/m.29710 type:complete len:255 (-) Transcript_15658:149-913(-)
METHNQGHMPFGIHCPRADVIKRQPSTTTHDNDSVLSRSNRRPGIYYLTTGGWVRTEALHEAVRHFGQAPGLYQVTHTRRGKKRKNEDKKNLLAPAAAGSAMTIEADSRSNVLTDPTGWVSVKRRRPVPVVMNIGFGPSPCMSRGALLMLIPGCLSHILSFLDVRSLARAACVCKDLRKLAKDDTLWENLSSTLAPTTLAPHPMITAMQKKEGRVDAYYSRVKLVVWLRKASTPKRKRRRKRKRKPNRIANPRA